MRLVAGSYNSCVWIKFGLRDFNRATAASIYSASPLSVLSRLQRISPACRTSCKSCLAGCLLCHCCRAAHAKCSGYLPGNCRFESGTGYMMCNSEYCKRFGLPAQTNICASVALCNRMCREAAAAGGRCIQDKIPWQLDGDAGCRSVQIIRRQMIFPNWGPVNCDAEIGCKGSTCDLLGRCATC